MDSDASEFKSGWDKGVAWAEQKAVKEGLVPPIKEKMELSVRLIYGAFLFFVLLVAACITLEAVTGYWPREIVEVFIWPFIAGTSTCIGACCYKEKAKK